jgi:hypothetical protein
MKGNRDCASAILAERRGDCGVAETVHGNAKTNVGVRASTFSTIRAGSTLHIPQRPEVTETTKDSCEVLHVPMRRVSRHSACRELDPKTQSTKWYRPRLAQRLTAQPNARPSRSRRRASAHWLAAQGAARHRLVAALERRRRRLPSALRSLNVCPVYRTANLNTCLMYRTANL